LRILAFVRQDNEETITVAQASYVATPAVAAVVEQLVGPSARMDASDPSEVWISDAYVVDSVTNVGDEGYDDAASSAQYATPVAAEPIAGGAVADGQAVYVEAEAVRSQGAAEPDQGAEELDSIMRLAGNADVQHRQSQEGRPNQDRANRAHNDGTGRLGGEIAVTAMIVGGI